MSSLPSNELSSCSSNNNKDNNNNDTGTNNMSNSIGRRPRKWLSSSTSSLFSALSIAAPSSQCTASTQRTNSRSTATNTSSNISFLGAPYNNIYPPPVRFTQTYEILEQVDGGQKGVHSTVWLAMDKRSSSDYVAVKIVPRANLSLADDRAVFDEVTTLKKLNSASAMMNHPRSAKIPNWNDGVLTLLDFFVTKECFFIVTEYLDGGDLWEQLEKRGRFREVEAKGIVKSLLRTVRFIHSNNVCHRDIKPENILVGTVVTKRVNNSTTTNNKRVQQKIKLADFGLSTTVDKKKSLLGRCGTPMYVAPEVLMGRPYDYSCDMWSIGVLVYLFLSGCPPFFDNNKHRLYEQIISGTYHFTGDWDSISPEAKDFIESCLTLNPDDRMTADESLRHKWFTASNKNI